MTAHHPLCDPMPLLSSAFEPGRCRELVESMPEGPARGVARAELLYFTGQAEAAAAAARPLLTSDDLSVLLSASLVLGYASLSLGQADDARAALGTARAAVGEGLDDADPLASAVASFFVTTARTLLHLPLPERVPPLEDCVGLLPEGLRPFALYVLAHQAYLVGEHGRCVGVAEAALAVQGEARPITNTYLHLACVMGYVGMRDVGAARAHLLAAWDLARPDGLIEPFGEHHGLLGGMLEAVIKRGWPDDFRRIIDITYRFSAGWRLVHNPVTGEEVADNLTTTEFASAMLAARGWTNQEIADHLGVSINTAKRHLSHAMEKLGVGSRKGLEHYMLR